MAEVTAASVRDLRAMTDAPMMECKKALVEAGGDMEKAVDLLRVRLGNKASKSATRIAAEGVVFVKVCGESGVLVEINCETDFVAKDDSFKKFAEGVADSLIVQSKASTLADIGSLPFGLESGQTIEVARVALSGKIGENISIRRFHRITSSHKFASYVHNNRIGVLVEYEGEDAMVARNVAMHIAAMKPLALSKEQIPQETLDRERKVSLEKASQTGKSPEIIKKMVDGSITKFLAEVSLLDQKYVRDDSQTVRQMTVLAKTTIFSFVLYVVGEGIEKEVANFAEEVSRQASIV